MTYDVRANDCSRYNFHPGSVIDRRVFAHIDTSSYVHVSFCDIPLSVSSLFGKQPEKQTKCRQGDPISQGRKPEARVGAGFFR